MMVTVQQLVETEALREYLPQCHCVHHKSHMNRPGLEPKLPQWETSNKLPELCCSKNALIISEDFPISSKTKITHICTQVK
jgi:hypothetical protein